MIEPDRFVRPEELQRGADAFIPSRCPRLEEAHSFGDVVMSPLRASVRTSESPTSDAPVFSFHRRSCMMGNVIRIGLLRMAELPEAGLGVHGPYVSVFEMLFDDRPVELVDVPVHEGATPESLADCEGWIITGSPASVYEDLDWIRTGEEIVRAAFAEERPLVGICFGHQLVAQALGGRVEKAANGWGIGAHRYETVRSLPWIEGATTLLASHQDQVVEVPTDATVWSTSDYCPVAGMVLGERMLTVQGHPEFTPALVSALYDSRRYRLGDAAVDAAKATLSTPLSNASVADAIVRLITG